MELSGEFRSFETLFRMATRPPRLHPNGFIQVDLGERRRLHVWPEEKLPAAEPVTPIHDHVYGFRSLIIRGALRNVECEPVFDPSGGTHVIHEVYPWVTFERTSPIWRSGDRTYLAKIVQVSDFYVGTRYRFPPRRFHASEPLGSTATVIEIEPFDRSERARILAPVGIDPDASFKREGHDPDRLWGLIRETLFR
jgi:hypothetical protein